MRLAYEKICEINKTLEGAADRVKDAMLDEEKSFEEVRQWYDNRKQDLIPVRNLTDRIKQALSELEKQEIHKREEDWFHKKFELEMALEEKKAAQEMTKHRRLNYRSILSHHLEGTTKIGLDFGTNLPWK